MNHEDIFKNKNSGVILLSNNDFDRNGSLLGKYGEGVVTVMFYATWCGHCLNTQPMYIKAHSICRFNNCVATAVDCTDKDSLPGKLKNVVDKYVQGFPTLVQFKDGEFDRVYEGERTPMALMKSITGVEEYNNE